MIKKNPFGTHVHNNVLLVSKTILMYPTYKEPCTLYLLFLQMISLK